MTLRVGRLEGQRFDGRSRDLEGGLGFSLGPGFGRLVSCIGFRGSFPGKEYLGDCIALFVTFVIVRLCDHRIISLKPLEREGLA